MAQFTSDAAQRIVVATRDVERRMRNAQGHRGRWLGQDGDELVWFELIENLQTEDKTDPAKDTAKAHMLRWKASANDGDGDYERVKDEDDEPIEYDVRDTIKMRWGLITERLACRLLFSENGTVWEVVIPGSSWHFGVLLEELEYESTAEAEIELLWFDAEEGAETEKVKIMVHDEFLLPGQTLEIGAQIGIEYWHKDHEWKVTETEC